MSIVRNRSALGALIGLALFGTTASARADIADYEFRLINPEVARVGDATITVELRHKPTGERIADAVLFAKRLDMEPDGMATMISPVELLPATEPGIYRFRTLLTMAGGWRLSLAAKIQGESDTLVNRLVLKVAP